MKKAYLQSSEEVLSALDTTASGLTSEQAAKRMETYGPNKLKEAQKIPNFRRFLNQLKDPSTA